MLTKEEGDMAIIKEKNDLMLKRMNEVEFETKRGLSG